MKIDISYDGAYPNLCSGRLIVTIDGTVWEFPKYCLGSGGRVWFDNNWEEQVESGEWSICEWPDGFPEELKEKVLDEVNYKIELGCCGGCL